MGPVLREIDTYPTKTRTTFSRSKVERLVTTLIVAAFVPLGTPAFAAQASFVFEDIGHVRVVPRLSDESVALILNPPTGQMASANFIDFPEGHGLPASLGQLSLRHWAAGPMSQETRDTLSSCERHALLVQRSPALYRFRLIVTYNTTSASNPRLRSPSWIEVGFDSQIAALECALDKE